MSQETRGWIESCEVTPGRGRRTLENHSPSRVRCKKWEIFCTIALKFAGVVTALSDHFGRGAVPSPAYAQSCPALTARLAGEMPSSREGDRYVLRL